MPGSEYARDRMGGDCTQAGSRFSNATVERPAGVQLSIEELTRALSDLESAVQAIDARLGPACLQVPTNAQCDGPRPTAGCDRSQIAQIICKERERVTSLADRLRQILAVLDV
jgi:hypothetical protein